MLVEAIVVLALLGLFLGIRLSMAISSIKILKERVFLLEQWADFIDENLFETEGQVTFTLEQTKDKLEE